MPKKVLVTGFSPFLNFEVNPSQMVAQKLDGQIVDGISFTGKILPVSYSDVESVLMNYLDEVKPDLVIGTGLAPGRPKLSVEKIAINYKYSREPDNSGTKATGDRIDPKMPDGIFSLLEVEPLVELLNRNNIPAEISTTAGSYLCNYAMFIIVREARNRGIRGGFVHLPSDPSLAVASKIRSMPSMNLDTMVQGIRLAALRELGAENTSKSRI